MTGSILPPYVEPPWHYVNSSLLNVVVRLKDPSRLSTYLSSGVQAQAGQDLVVFMFLDAPAIPELGTEYHSTECGLILPVETPGGVRGGQYSFMLVDNDPAVSAGREIWGFPKKLGQVRVRHTSERDVEAQASHLPYREWNGAGVMQVSAHLDGSNDWLREEVKALEPRILSRQTRFPDGRPSEWVHTLQGGGVTQVHERASGTATIEFGDSRQEQLEQLGPYEVLGALYTRCDFVLDYGSPVT